MKNGRVCGHATWLRGNSAISSASGISALRASIHSILTREPTSVRDAYRYLTVLAARHGDARSPSETPSAFSSRMKETWSDVDPEIADLTDRYLRVRYGEFPDDPERDAARSDWRAIWRNHPLDKDGT